MNPFRMDDSLREGRVPIYPSTICRSYGTDREAVRLALEAENIEARPVWKPMHRQPVFQVERLKAEGSRLEAGENDPQITQIDADYKNKGKRYKARVVGGTSRGQKSDVRGQEGKDRDRRSEVGGQGKTEVGGRRSDVSTERRKQRYAARLVGGEVAEDLFNRGLCLPSGTAMTDGDLDRVIETILNCKK